MGVTFLNNGWRLLHTIALWHNVSLLSADAHKMTARASSTHKGVCVLHATVSTCTHSLPVEPSFSTS